MSFLPDVQRRQALCAGPSRDRGPGRSSAALAAMGLGLVLLPWIGTADAGAASSENAIVVLVNDEPITAYEVEQRGRLLGLSANIGEYIKKNAKSRWEKIIKAPNINDEFRAYAVKRNPKSKEELQKIQQEFVRDKQKSMMEQLQREARAQASRGTEKQAIRELVEERLKLQEAKRNNVLAGDDEIERVISGIAQRNKMTNDQFAKHLAGMGVDISTMKQRFRATISWQSVVRRRFLLHRRLHRRRNPTIAPVCRRGRGPRSRAGPRRRR